MTTLWLVFAPLLVAWGTAIVWCAERWNAPTQYFEHCWLVPAIAAFVVWRRRAQWSAEPRAADARGWWLLAPALALHAAGAALMIDSWSATSLVLAVPGACWLALGRARLRGHWPIVWLVLFAVPMPIYVEGRVAFVLKEFAVQSGAALGNLLGADVVRTADHLQPRGMQGALFVADACGGLRSLLAMLTVAYCLAFFWGGTAWLRRTVLFAAAPALAIGANIARIALLCVFARHGGVPFAESTGHTLANVAEWVLVLIALLGLDRLLPQGPDEATSRPATAVSVATAAALASRGTAGLARSALVLWSFAPLLLALSLYRPASHAADRAAALPTRVAGYELVPRTREEEADFQKHLPRWCDLLGTRDFVWRYYRDASGAGMNLVALFHDTNWKSVHPPRLCIEGSDMDIEVDDLVAGPAAADAMFGRIVARARSDGVRYVTLSVFGTADWLSGDYWQFTRHHLPRALVRASVSGFLLRAESAVRAGEHEADAEARCRTFLEALIPPARDQLR
jgi:exosortase